MTRVFFDIDGTLIHPGSAGKEAFLGAVSRVSKKFPLPEVSFSGKTDRGILFALLGSKTDCEIHFEEVYNLYFESLKIGFHPSSGAALQAGVSELLEGLHQKEIRPGIITGNIQRAAQFKLQTLGIDQYFSSGVYGDHHYDRVSLTEQAVALARTDSGLQPSAPTPREIVIIGDTPDDVSSGKMFGCTTVAVATGRFSYGELKTYNPDYLFSSFTPEAISEITSLLSHSQAY